MSLLEVIKRYHHICWYPSAGPDFRPLLFLSKQYCVANAVQLEQEHLPDLFLFTDAYPTEMLYNLIPNDPWCRAFGTSYIDCLNRSDYAKEKILYRDEKTTISVRNQIRLIDQIATPLDRALFKFEPSPNFGKVFWIPVHVTSRRYGEWDADVVYVLTENTHFGVDYLLKHHVKMDYVIRVRYGDAFGESKVNGDWLTLLLEPLQTKVFLSPYIRGLKAGETYFTELDEDDPIRELERGSKVVELKAFYRVSGRQWSGQGDIIWYAISDLRKFKSANAKE